LCFCFRLRKNRAEGRLGLRAQL